jgi:hypothetical protein
MPRRPIIPNSDIVLGPLETDLGVVVLSEELILGLSEIVTNLRGLVRGVLDDLR